MPSNSHHPPPPPSLNPSSPPAMHRLLLRPASSAAARARRLSSTAVTAAVDAAPAENKSGDNLGRRLLRLVYAKRSAVVTINKWKEEGHVVRKYALNRIVRELRKLKRFKHALEICEWMTLQQDIHLLPGDYAVHLDLIAKVRGLNSAEKFFEDLPEKMIGPTTCSALLHVYTQNQSWEKATALMEKMLECGFINNPLPFNHMLSMYIANGQLEKVPQVIEELKRKTTPDLVTYNLWLTMCKEQGDVENAERILLELKKTRLSPDWFTYSILSNLYMKVSATEKVPMALKEMEKRATRKNRAAFSSLISLHTIMKNREEVFRIWTKMKSLFQKMSDAEYTCMTASVLKLGEIEEAEKLYAEWVTVSTSRNPSIRNLLLAAYINSNQMDKAERLYNQVMSIETVAPCYTTYELMAWGYIKEKQMDKALCFLEKAIASVKEWNFDKKMVWELFEKLEEEGNVEGAEKLLVILRGAGCVSTRVYNSLLRTYAKAGVMPLIINERMKKDDVCSDDETRELIEKTRNMCATEVSCKFSKLGT